MPHSDIHKKKRRKNLAVLGLIFLWCAVIWLVTMIRIANAQTPAEALEVQRARHLEKIHQTHAEWEQTYHDDAILRRQAGEDMTEARDTHLEYSRSTKGDWDKNYHDSAPAMRGKQEQMEQSRADHHQKTNATPAGWHEGWLVRQEGGAP